MFHKILKLLTISVCAFFVISAHADTAHEFTITTTSNTTSFSFKISVAGAYNIGISGQAIAYNTSTSTASD